MVNIIVNYNIHYSISTEESQSKTILNAINHQFTDYNPAHKTNPLDNILQLDQSKGKLAIYKNSYYQTFRRIYEDDSVLYVGIPSYCNDEILTYVNEECKKEKLVEEFKAKHILPIFPRKISKDLSIYLNILNDILWNRVFNNIYNFYDEKKAFEQYKDLNKIFAEKIASVYKKGDRIIINSKELWYLPKLLHEMGIDNISISFLIDFIRPDLTKTIPYIKELIESISLADLLEFQNRESYDNYIDSYFHIMKQPVSESSLFLLNRQGADLSLLNNFKLNERIKRHKKNLMKTFNDPILLCISSLDSLYANKYVLFALENLLSNSDMKVHFVNLILSEGNIDPEISNENLQIVEYLRTNYSVNIENIYVTDDALYFAFLQIAQFTVILDNRIAETAFLYNKAGILLPLTNYTEYRKCNGIFKEDLRDIFKIANIFKENLGKSIKYRREPKDYEEYFNRLTSIKIIPQKIEQEPVDEEILIEKITEATNPIFLLDYDGTIMEIVQRPIDAKPNDEIKNLLSELSKKYKVFIVTGQMKECCDDFFNFSENLNIIAEHGAFIRTDNIWGTNNYNLQWKEQAKKIINFFIERTPNLTFEDKNIALTVHYRMVENFLHHQIDILQDVLYLHFKDDFRIIRGKEILEILPINITKGNAVDLCGDSDLFIAIGDDVTDNDMMMRMGENDISIEVGENRKLQAKNFFKNPTDVRAFLKKLI